MTEETTVQQEKSKGQLALERKSRQIQDSRSIVVLISESALPRNIVFSIFELDRNISFISRNVGFLIPLADAKKKMEEVKEVVTSLWEKVKEIIPNLLSFDYENWREINDSEELKQKLIKRRNSVVFIPRTEEAAQIMMAFRELSKKRINFSAAGNLEGVEKIAKVYVEFAKQIKELNESLLKIRQKNGQS